MGTVKMSITRALVEKKRLTDRISKAIAAISPATVVIGEKAIPAGYTTVNDFVTSQTAAFQSAKDLISRYNNIVMAIAQSNAITKIKINDTELTVAQALERKKSITFTIIALQKRLENINNHVTTNLLKAEENYNTQLTSIFNSFVGKDKKIETDAIEEIKKQTDAAQKPVLITAFNIIKEINALRNEQEEFLMNIDTVITESNSITQIEF